MGQGAIYYQKVVKPVLHSFMGPVFEDMCSYYTLTNGISGAYECFVTSVGTWWGDREYSPLLSINDAYPKMIIARTHHEPYDYRGGRAGRKV